MRIFLFYIFCHAFFDINVHVEIYREFFQTWHSGAASAPFAIACARAFRCGNSCRWYRRRKWVAESKATDTGRNNTPRLSSGGDASLSSFLRIARVPFLRRSRILPVKICRDMMADISIRPSVRPRRCYTLCHGQVSRLDFAGSKVSSFRPGGRSMSSRVSWLEFGQSKLINNCDLCEWTWVTVASIWYFMLSQYIELLIMRFFFNWCTYYI